VGPMSLLQTIGNFASRTIIVATVAFAALTSQAHASVIVTLWQGSTGGTGIGDPREQALPTNPFASGTPLATFTYSGNLNWSAIDPNNFLDTFVGFGGGSVSGCVGSACASATTLAHTLLSSSSFNLTSLFRIVFSTSGPETGSITHDDGISIFDATDTTVFLNSATPTAALTSLYSLPSAGTYHLWYVEANGAPSVLNVIPDEVRVPEPTSLVLIATALFGLLGLGLRRRAHSAS
jgi:hypothetical protein